MILPPGNTYFYKVFLIIYNIRKTKDLYSVVYLCKHMVKKVNINNIELEILSLFTKGYNKQYYIREISKKLNISSRTSLINLNKLEKKGILESYTKGKIRLFKIKKSFLTKNYFLLTEQFKLIKFLEKNNKIKEILKKIFPLIKGTAIIFGSYAKEKQKKSSDLDIFIIGQVEEKLIKQIELLYNIKINTKVYPKEIFEKNIDDDILIKEIKENHIIIKNSEYFLNVIIKIENF